MKLTLTHKIIIGFILGLALGEFFYLFFSPETSHDLASKVQVVSKIFLRLIKAPSRKRLAPAGAASQRDWWPDEQCSNRHHRVPQPG